MLILGPMPDVVEQLLEDLTFICGPAVDVVDVHDILAQPPYTSYTVSPGWIWACEQDADGMQWELIGLR